MKYLYAIFRLFKCPHKFKQISKITIRDGNEVVGHKLVKDCSKCGTVRSFKL